MTGRLNSAALASLAPTVARPGYDRARLAPGIVHLGVGACHRAHQAAYTDAALAQPGAPLDWGIVGVSLRSPTTRDALGPQDGLYTIAVRDGADTRLQVVGALTRLLVMPEDPEAVLAALADAATRVITLTVTEKGYCHDPATGTLDEARPEVVADIASPRAPATAIGVLVEGLRRRRDAGLPPATVVCCDNLPSNGAVVRRVVLRLAELVEPALARWIGDHVTFPCTMVDRIVPATTDADRSEVAGLLGVEDRWPVMTEPFTQWVIEDAFCGSRPDWAAAGAQFVGEVEPFEQMKLRLLNASHSTMAYLGYLAGYATIAQTIGDPAFARLVRALMDAEMTPTLSLPPGVDLTAYKDALIARFGNPALKHTTYQIAMDGSQKLPQRLLAPARRRLAAGQPIGRIALAVAGWMRYAAGVDEAGNPIAVQDPLADTLKQRAAPALGDAEAMAKALLGVPQVFGSDLAAAPGFVDPVVAALKAILAGGARAAVEAAAKL